MTTHIARVIGLEPPTHYHRAFSSVGLCGEAGPHSLTPTCGNCQFMIEMEADGLPLNEWLSVPRCVYCRRELR